MMLTEPVPAPLPSTAKVLEWLRALSPAPYRPRAVSMRDDVPANGELSLFWRRGYALGFSGSRDFIARMHAFAVNTGLIGAAGELHWFLEGHESSTAYVCPRDGNDSLTGVREAVIKALTLQFRAEIVAANEVPPLSNAYAAPDWEETWGERTVEERLAGMIVHDEVAIERLATERAEAFFAEHVKIDGAKFADTRQFGPVYGLVAPGRAEGTWGAGAEAAA